MNGFITGSDEKQEWRSPELDRCRHFSYSYEADARTERKGGLKRREEMVDKPPDMHQKYKIQHVLSSPCHSMTRTASGLHQY